jgi:formyltetrahydrofolate-dependent phosphoribosylglycinamide formyltransferase
LKPVKGRRLNVDILISGRGTNMAALIAASKNPECPAVVSRVISNRPDAAGLAVAAREGIETVVVDHKAYRTREAHEEALHKAISSRLPDLICLAGYMRILSARFVHLHEGRILNIHPSLLPAFTGIDTHARALAAGVKIHGATVHFVTEKLDDGPIVAQVAVPVLAGDSVETLSARVLEAENRLYPHALSLIASGNGRAAASGSKDQALFWPPLPQ